MRIEIDKKAGLVVGVIAVLFFGLGFAINNGDDNEGMIGFMHSNSSNNSAFSANDIMFAQMMIPHHQQAVEMSDLALSISKDPDILVLAKQIRDAQAPEISQMKGWLTQSGTSLMGAHGMAMQGMLTDAEISTLKASTGKTFDKLFLTGMISHHEGALTMIKMIQKSKNEEARKLAASINSSQSAEIELMKAYLKNLSQQ